MRHNIEQDPLKVLSLIGWQSRYPGGTLFVINLKYHLKEFVFTPQKQGRELLGLQVRENVNSVKTSFQR
jgi:hypothetical protein